MEAPAAYRIRRAAPRDGAQFLRLVVELARFEKMAPPNLAARRRLVRDAFGPRPRFELYVAEATPRPGAVGYAIAAWTYSSFEAKPTLWLEDIYLTPRHRGTGLGLQFLRFLAARALAEDAARLEGIVLSWNRRARAFYARTGAAELRDWLFFRYREAALRRLARAATPLSGRIRKPLRRRRRR